MSFQSANGLSSAATDRQADASAELAGHGPSLAADISRAVVQLMHEYTGRGPTTARAHISRDLITVVLQETLTAGERTLIRDGQAELVLALRRAFQASMEAQLVAAVERYSGRTVTAFLSANTVDPDVAVESFVLAPV